ncbi:peptidoglycan recognition protein family protein [Bacillus sp. Marseille-P3661]|uniref:peptidoglycan recognition protein family protein n=1 Tax=Bacillus sp. Marseille-P3661 TaxID=1936234 RepID=UPI000C81F47D|nr:peptidoglycan recognition family protein [Bacillus sp. Marseille-P3661]
MAPNFTSYTINEFQSFIRTVTVKRRISHIQIHHTWKPRKSDYKGESTIAAMWRYHTQERGWNDIGQHFSVAPDGLIWDGRSLEHNPAGISGHNTGGIMFEMIGNFDKGEEVLEGKQLDAIVIAIRVLLDKFKLGFDDIVFHREHATKSCPGTGITKAWFLDQVKNRKVTAVKGITSPTPYTEAPEWKQNAIDCLFEEGLLTSENWKETLEKGLPLWAEATVLYRIYNQYSKKNG